MFSGSSNFEIDLEDDEHELNLFWAKVEGGVLVDEGHREGEEDVLVDVLWKLGSSRSPRNIEDELMIDVVADGEDLNTVVSFLLKGTGDGFEIMQRLKIRN